MVAKKEDCLAVKEEKVPNITQNMIVNLPSWKYDKDNKVFQFSCSLSLVMI